MSKILVIENQFLQYELLKKGLEDEDNIILPPNRDAYVEFIKAIKVYVAERCYPEEYRNACFDVIRNIIKPDNGVPVDLIIMDYKLGGSSICLTGQDLAIEVWGKIDRSIPILFLSRTAFSDERRFTQSDEMRDSCYRFDWLMKSFWGQDVMEDLFIKKTVKKKVHEMLVKEWPPMSVLNQELIDAVEKLLQLNCMPLERERFIEIRQFLKNNNYEIGKDTPFAKELLNRANLNRATTAGDLYELFNKIK